MQKIFDKIKAMSLGKKIYATLWATWFIMLIVFVGVASGLNPRVGAKAPGTWGISMTDDYKKTIDGNGQIVDAATVKGKTITLNNAEVLVSDVITHLQANAVANVAPAEAIYRDEAMKAFAADSDNQSGGVQMYKLVYTAGDLTADAQKATNAIAGVGLGFFITMAAAVFTTVGVEVAAKKGGKK